MSTTVIPSPKKVRRIDEGKKLYSSSMSYRVYLHGELTERIRFARDFFMQRMKKELRITFAAGEAPNPVAPEDVLTRAARTRCPLLSSFFLLKTAR